MQTKRVSNEMLKNIKGYETREAYVSPYDSLTEDRKVASDSSNIKEQVRRDKLVSSLREAIEKCEENKERECWVYLEIKTDRYIREDEIKRMKDLKKDILEILPKLNSDVEEESAISIQEKSFEEIFREFYKKEREVEADNEVVDLLLRLLNEEGDDSETN